MSTPEPLADLQRLNACRNATQLLRRFVKGLIRLRLRELNSPWFGLLPLAAERCMPYVDETVSRSILGAALPLAVPVQSVLTAALSPSAAAGDLIAGAVAALG